MQNQDLHSKYIDVYFTHKKAAKKNDQNGCENIQHFNKQYNNSRKFNNYTHCFFTICVFECCFKKMYLTSDVFQIQFKTEMLFQLMKKDLFQTRHLRWKMHLSQGKQKVLSEEDTVQVEENIWKMYLKIKSVNYQRTQYY